MLHIKVNDGGKKGGKPAPIFFHALAKTNWCNKRWVTLFPFLKKGKKKKGKSEDRCAFSFKKTHPRDVFKARK